jgi:prepilin-type N-terminal cleavage/methylation domain-containing protein
MRIRNRRGFTLIELLAALSISGLAMLGGILLLDQVTDSSARIVRGGNIAASEGNGPRLLKQLFLDAGVTADSADRFRGDERSADFSTACQNPGGWMEHCRVSLGIDQRMDTSVVFAALARGEHLEVVRYVGQAEFRYFDPVSGDAKWLSRWVTSIAMPIAIGIVLGGDTLVYPMGTARD